MFQNKLTAYKSAGKSIIYIDESGFEHHMPRKYGYSLRGKHCYGSKDWGAKSRTNVIGALLGKTLLTVALFDGTINSDVFYSWVKHDLLPKLNKQAVIVMDNATFHKRQDVQDIFKDTGHILEYLPAYCPQLNPIEQKWAQAKSIRKKLKCDTETLFKQNIF